MERFDKLEYRIRLAGKYFSRAEMLRRRNNEPF